MRTAALITAPLLCAALLAGCAEPAPPHVEMAIEGKGTVTLELVPELAPQTCDQILRLIDDGFYDGQRIHRVESWVVQWGDPKSKREYWERLPLGTSGSGTPLPFESNDIKMERGVLAMASTGARVGGDSQMFILTNVVPQQAESLQGNYCVFGFVVKGMDIVENLTIGDKITMKRSGE